MKVVTFNEKTSRFNPNVVGSVVIIVADLHGFCVGKADFKRSCTVLVGSSG